MKYLYAAKSYLMAVLLSALAVACSQEVSAPTPLAIEQVPDALQKSFKKGKPEAKDLVNQIVTSLQAQDYSKAYLDLQSLGGQSGLNKEQQSVASRSALTVNGLLQQAAQTKGDTKAAQTLNNYRINK